MDTDSLLDVDAVAQRLQIKPATVRAYHKRGEMPRADKYFGRSPVWKADTIQAWVECRPRKATQ